MNSKPGAHRSRPHSATNPLLTAPAAMEPRADHSQLPGHGRTLGGRVLSADMGVATANRGMWQVRTSSYLFRTSFEVVKRTEICARLSCSEARTVLDSSFAWCAAFRTLGSDIRACCSRTATETPSRVARRSAACPASTARISAAQIRASCGGVASTWRRPWPRRTMSRAAKSAARPSVPSRRPPPKNVRPDPLRNPRKSIGSLLPYSAKA